jgi:methionine-rich copper-binding protein CopC
MSRKRFGVSSITSSLAIFSALITGCGGSHPNPVSPSAPSSPGASSASSFSVSGSAPASGATNVALDATIQITFSSAVDAGTVNTTDFVVTDPQAVSGSVSYNSSNNTVTFTPSTPLAADSTYTVKVSGVTSSSGAAMAGAYSFSFATAKLQYQASLDGHSGDVGQVNVDTSGNVTVQLSGAAASQALTVQFCPLIPTGKFTSNCFSVATVNTDASGNGSVTAMFPKTGAWVGDFQLVTSPGFTYTPDYVTVYTPVYMSTVVPNSTDNTLEGSPVANQAPLTSGTITYSSSPQPNGSLQFVLTGAPPNDTIEAAEGGLPSDDYYSIGGTYTTDSAGDVTFTVSPSGNGGDIIDVSPQNGQVGWEGGFSVPQ